MNLHDELVRLQRASGISGRAAARAVGVSAPAWITWTTGRYRPTNRNLRRIESAFGLKRGHLDAYTTQNDEKAATR